MLTNCREAILKFDSRDKNAIRPDHPRLTLAIADIRTFAIEIQGAPLLVIWVDTRREPTGPMTSRSVLRADKQVVEGMNPASTDFSIFCERNKNARLNCVEPFSRVAAVVVKPVDSDKAG